jgi:serine/threonine protein phosphatase 1
MSKHVIGDIHGCYYTLSKLIDKVLEQDKNPEFIFTGDYIDRGLYSKSVISFLLDLEKKYKCTFLLGNHDDVFKYLLGLSHVTNLGDYIFGKVTTQSIYDWMRVHGIKQTIDSFGIDNLEMLPEIDDYYLDFFRKLEIGYIDDKFFVFHGFYPNQEVPRDIRFIKGSQKEELIWGRFDELLSNYNKYSQKWDRIGIFGHTPTRYITGKNEPLVLDKIVMIDTEAYRGSFLTSYNTETGQFIQVPTDKRDIL